MGLGWGWMSERGGLAWLFFSATAGVWARLRRMLITKLSGCRDRAVIGSGGEPCLSQPGMDGMCFPNRAADEACWLVPLRSLANSLLVQLSLSLVSRVWSLHPSTACSSAPLSVNISRSMAPTPGPILLEHAGPRSRR
ncbi:hypothetical protein QBC39DRAFT_141479 [Podospora conica]|nr:hypothetical protein QBC39DRAFT_141479 [Schizothecium conicum]